ncbi:MAG: Gfo/Idh/MocA family protein [Aestuariivirga sp.]
MKPVKWGVVSTANIGVAKVIPGMLKSSLLEVAAIASRDLATGEKAAKRLGIPKAYGSYEELLADPEIEAIYNPLPNHLHVPITLTAAKAGKHVLCEKPIAMTAKEAEKLKRLPKGIMVAEAFMVRHHPQWIAARELARSGALGELRAIQVFFSYYNDDPANVRNMADIGGGGLLDIGCYPITVSRFIFDGDPSRVVALVDRDPKFKTDRTLSGLADFGKGRQLSFTVSTQAAPYQRVNILGTKGRVEIMIPFNAPQDRITRYAVHIENPARHENIEVPVADQYQLQAEAFSRAIRGEEPLGWGTADAIMNMKIIDAFFRSEKSKKWEKV